MKQKYSHWLLCYHWVHQGLLYIQGDGLLVFLLSRGTYLSYLGQSVRSLWCVPWAGFIIALRSCSVLCMLSPLHYNDVIMGTIAYQITSLTIVYSIVYSDVDQRKHQSSASLAFVRGIHKWPVKRKIFPFDDVVMVIVLFVCSHITLLHHQYYADVSEGVKLLKFLSGIFCGV